MLGFLSKNNKWKSVYIYIYNTVFIIIFLYSFIKLICCHINIDIGVLMLSRKPAALQEIIYMKTIWIQGSTKMVVAWNYVIPFGIQTRLINWKSKNDNVHIYIYMDLISKWCFLRSSALKQVYYAFSHLVNSCLYYALFLSLYHLAV